MFGLWVEYAWIAPRCAAVYHFHHFSKKLFPCLFSDLSCSDYCPMGPWQLRKMLSNPSSEEKLLGLEACQLQILGLETFGELREAKLMRLRQGQGKGEVLAGYWHKKRDTKWLESVELRLVPIFLVFLAEIRVWPMKSRLIISPLLIYSHSIPLFILTSRYVSRPMTWEIRNRWLRIQTLSHAPAVEETEAKPAAVIPLGNARSRWSFQWDFRIYSINGGFLKFGYPKMDGLEWKILLTWMI